MRALVRRLGGDPFARSLTIAALMIAGGFVAIFLAYRGVARSVNVAVQLPYVVSGGVGGLALILTGAGIIAVQSSRYWSARERQWLDVVAARSAEVMEKLAR